MNHTALHVLSNSIKLRDVMQGTTYISHSTFGWSVGETVRCSISKIDRCSIPNIDRCLIPKIDQCAVAEVNDRLIAEWDRSQNRTAAPLLEHGIGPSLYCSIKKPLVVKCLVARPPGPPYHGLQHIGHHRFLPYLGLSQHSLQSFHGGLN